MLICFIGCGKTVSQNHAILTRGKWQSLKIINAFTFEPAVSLLEIYTPQNRYLQDYSLHQLSNS